MPFDLHHPANPLKAFVVDAAAARLEHPDAVGERGDRRTETLTEVLAVRADPQAVVAARAPRGRNDRERAGDSTDLGALTGRQLVRGDASRPRPPELIERPDEPTEVVVTQRGRNVD